MQGEAAKAEADGSGSASDCGVPARGNDDVGSRTSVSGVDVGGSPVGTVASAIFPFTEVSAGQGVGEEGVPVGWSPGVSSIAGAADGPSSLASAGSMERALTKRSSGIFRDKTRGETPYDAKIDAEDDALALIALIEPEAKPEPEFDGRLFSNKRLHGAVHLSTHLPKVPGCDACGLAKAVKSQSRRKN